MSKFSSADYLYMKAALREARKGRFSTSPNPAVGCVIVKDGVIVGTGFHHRAGEGHAEVMALKSAGTNVQGATVYVTLEPCSHYGRTPPCAAALVKAGVSRVVAAIGDPNPKVSGRGLEILRKAGVKAEVGLLEKEAYNLNRAFFKSIQGQGPYVTVKVAASLDSKIALASGESKWITNDKSRAYVQRLRARADAVITGVNTVLADNPRLNVRYQELPKRIRKSCSLYEDRQPLKVILDSHGSLIPRVPEFTIFQEGKTLIVINDEDLLLKLVQDGILVHEETDDLYSLNDKVMVFLAPKTVSGLCDLKALLKLLDEFSIRRVLVEAGSRLNASFLEENLADELFVFEAPKILGTGSKEAFALMAPTLLKDAKCFKLKKVKTLGDDVMLRYVKE